MAIISGKVFEGQLIMYLRLLWLLAPNSAVVEFAVFFYNYNSLAVHFISIYSQNVLIELHASNASIKYILVDTWSAEIMIMCFLTSIVKAKQWRYDLNCMNIERIDYLCLPKQSTIHESVLTVNKYVNPQRKTVHYEMGLRWRV